MSKVITTKVRFETEVQRKKLKRLAKHAKQSGNQYLLSIIESEHKRLFKC